MHFSKWIKAKVGCELSKGAVRAKLQRRADRLDGKRRTLLVPVASWVVKAHRIGAQGQSEYARWGTSITSLSWPNGATSMANRCDESIMLGCMMYDTGARHRNDSSSVSQMQQLRSCSQLDTLLIPVSLFLVPCHTNLLIITNCRLYSLWTSLVHQKKIQIANQQQNITCSVKVQKMMWEWIVVGDSEREHHHQQAIRLR